MPGPWENYQKKAPPKKTVTRPPVTTRKQEVSKAARAELIKKAGTQAAKKRKGANTNFTSALGAGIRRSLFGVPERLAAAGLRYLPSSITGNETDLNYDELLQAVRAATDEELGGSTSGNIIGQIVGSVGGGGVAAKGIGQLGGKLAASGAPVLARAGNIIKSATTLQKGRKLSNAAKIAGAGAAGGAAQAAGEGSDVKTGAAYGAGGAALFGAGAKGLGWLGGKASDLFRTSGADTLLRRYTSINSDELARRLADFRKRGKGEPTVYELLPLEDRQKFKQVSKRIPGEVRERAANLARERVQSIPGEVSNVVNRATQPAQKATAKNLVVDLVKSRGGQAPSKAERELAKKAVSNPTALAKLTRQEAENIMAPFDNTVAYESVNDLVPQIPVSKGDGTVVFKEDPAQKDIVNMIRNATQALRFSKNITVSDLTRVLRHLDERAAKGDIDTDIAKAAGNHIEDLIRQDHPEALDALAQMKAAFAGKMRMQEGIRELRLQQQVPAKTRSQSLLSENVFETPEGAAGRNIGQRLRTTENLGATTQSGLGAVREIAESPIAQQTLQQNLGGRAAGEITQAAQVQSESARKLATAMVEQPDSIGEIEAGDLALLASALNPTSMTYTKFRAVAEISKFLRGIPENRARTLVDMLFSRDPELSTRAINALRSSGQEGERALRSLTGALASGVIAASGGGENTAQLDTTQISPEDSELPEATAAPWEQYGNVDEDSPYAGDLQSFYENADPQLVDLVERVEQQESGGNQSAVSRTGAIGVMQVMPGTAREAAKLAGLPWDENAYYNDENYNRLLGISYLSEMLRRYNGDIELALAAYNAGPGRADQYASGERGLPAETQQYIARIL